YLYFFNHGLFVIIFILDFLRLMDILTLLFHFTCWCLALYNYNNLAYGYTPTSSDCLLQGCSSYPFICSFSLYVLSSFTYFLYSCMIHIMDNVLNKCGGVFH